MTQKRTFCHCEERSDVAISTFSTAPQSPIILINEIVAAFAAMIDTDPKRIIAYSTAGLVSNSSEQSQSF